MDLIRLFLERFLPILISLIPVMFIFTCLFYQNKKKTITYGEVFLLISAGIFGAFLTQMVIGNFILWSDVYKSLTNQQIMNNMFLMSCYSFISEFIKIGILLIIWFIYKKKNPHDIIVYACIISLLFAGIENVSYIMGESRMLGDNMISLVRAFTTLPLQTVNGVIVGYALFLGILNKKKSLWPYLIALILPVIISSIYNSAFINLIIIDQIYSDTLFNLSLLGICAFIFITYLIGVILVKESAMINRIFVSNEAYPERFENLMIRQEYEKKD